MICRHLNNSIPFFIEYDAFRKNQKGPHFLVCAVEFRPAKYWRQPKKAVGDGKRLVLTAWDCPYEFLTYRRLMRLRFPLKGPSYIPKVLTIGSTAWGYSSLAFL